jgi:hypothetical protein
MDNSSFLVSVIIWGFVWAGVCAYIAHMKNRPSWFNWVLAGFFFGPIALIIVLCTPSIEFEPDKRCPWCKAGVPTDAIVCMHCTRDMRDIPAAVATSAYTRDHTE